MNHDVSHLPGSRDTSDFFADTSYPAYPAYTASYPDQSTEMILFECSLLDHGFIRCLDQFGDELTIVNAARISFNTKKTQLDESDIKLIQYLVKNKHYSPFRHLMFRFHIKAPECVMRQWFKHVVGCEWSTASQLHGWNEMSGRYVSRHEYYIPKTWRKQSKNNKQASDGVFSNPEECQAIQDLYTDVTRMCDSVFNNLVSMGVAKEQARLVLPLSQYTEVIWTCSFQALMNFIQLRDEPTAQYEIRVYANVLRDFVKARCPNVTENWI